MWGNFVSISINDCLISENQKSRLLDLQKCRENGDFDDLSQLSDITIEEIEAVKDKSVMQADDDNSRSENETIALVNQNSMEISEEEEDSEVEQSNSIGQLEMVICDSESENSNESASTIRDSQKDSNQECSDLQSTAHADVSSQGTNQLIQFPRRQWMPRNLMEKLIMMEPQLS
jgi:hypothetical protein